MKAHLDSPLFVLGLASSAQRSPCPPKKIASTYGKCNNPHGHGHNYALEVTVSGQVDPRTGMVCNLVDLDGYVEREVLSRYDLAEFEYSC